MTVDDHNPAAHAEASGNSADIRVADATDANWVDRFAPAPMRPYLRLSRLDRPAGTWLLFIPCLWGLFLTLAEDPSRISPKAAWVLFGCAIGALLMRGAGCTWNDITDRKFDAEVARTRSRPLPSGQVSVRGAVVWMVVQALLAALILITFYPTAVFLGLASLALVAIYPFAKRFTWWPQIFLGLAFNWGAVLAPSAITNQVSGPVSLLYVAGIFWTLFYDTIYAHQDKEDDALIGVKSTARLFGSQTPRWLFAFLVLATILMALGTMLMLIGQSPYALLAGLFGVWAFAWHLVRQMQRLDLDDPDGCLRLFRSNKDAGLYAAAGFAFAALIGYVVRVWV